MDCPICYEGISPEFYNYCQCIRCESNMHLSCFNEWNENKNYTQCFFCKEVGTICRDN